MRNGDIVLVRFPFTDLDSSKKRPALVLRHQAITKSSRILTIAMITSKVDGLKLDGDVRLEDWEAEHLLHPSLVRLAKLATLEDSLVDRKLGALSKEDEGKVRKMFTKVYAGWIA